MPKKNNCLIRLQQRILFSRVGTTYVNIEKLRSCQFLTEIVRHIFIGRHPTHIAHIALDTHPHILRFSYVHLITIFLFNFYSSMRSAFAAVRSEVCHFSTPESPSSLTVEPIRNQARYASNECTLNDYNVVKQLAVRVGQHGSMQYSIPSYISNGYALPRIKLVQSIVFAQCGHQI